MADSVYSAFEQEALLVKLRRDREESEKFIAEQKKLMAEALKLDRDRMFAPLVAIAAFVGGLAGAIVAIGTFLARAH